MTKSAALPRRGAALFVPEREGSALLEDALDL
jgi:hypothetical protein